VQQPDISGHKKGRNPPVRERNSLHPELLCHIFAKQCHPGRKTGESGTEIEKKLMISGNFMEGMMLSISMQKTASNYKISFSGVRMNGKEKSGIWKPKF
jgi:hypothetical protein